MAWYSGASVCRGRPASIPAKDKAAYSEEDKAAGAGLIAVARAAGLRLAELSYAAGGTASAVLITAFAAADLAQRARLAQQIRADLLAVLGSDIAREKHLAALTQQLRPKGAGAANRGSVSSCRVNRYSR
jgi:hypothetical protein